MKLSELVNYKNELDKLSTELAKSTVNTELSKITHLTNNNLLTNQLENINSLFDTFNTTLDQVKQDIRAEIAVAEKPWFQESYRLHEEELWRPSAEYVFDVQLQKPTEALKATINTRLDLHDSWYYAGMVIRPGRESFIQQLVSFDPLYVLDRDYELLAPAVGQFNQAYQRRLRQYIINDVNQDVLLDKIPDGQFAFCVAYMYFNYKPLEVIKQYFNEIYNKLKPGGTLAFTFNDCDHSAAVELVERHFCCYTPGYLIRNLAEAIGFEIAYDWHEDGTPITWLELKKPGELNSLKGGQTLAKILPK